MAQRFIAGRNPDEALPAIGKLRLRSNEGLTGWVARERRLLAISREALGSQQLGQDARADERQLRCDSSCRRRFW